MDNQTDFQLTMTFDASPEVVFEAVAHAERWWSRELDGRSDRRGDEFTYRHGAVHCSTHRVTEANPETRVVWHTTAAHLSFDENPNEWVGTEVVFEIGRTGQRTQLSFTHRGLRPGLKCFEPCSRGWRYYVGESLRALIETGKGKPD